MLAQHDIHLRSADIRNLSSFREDLKQMLAPDEREKAARF